MIVEFKKEHTRAIRVQPAQMRVRMPDADELARFERGIAVTGLIDDRVIFCCGTHVEAWRGRPAALLWSLLSDEAWRYLTRITRIGQRLIALHSGIMVTCVQNDFPEAQRWIKMLGFEFLRHDEPVSHYMRYC